MGRLRILIADDHAVLREGLTLLINAESDMEVVAQAGSGREALRLLQEREADVAVLDVSMPDGDGAHSAEQIRERFPHVRVLALTRHADQGYLRRLLEAGAKGYVLKRTAADALIHAIRTIAADGTYIDPGLSSGLADRALGLRDTARSGNQRDSLTDRETEVLRLIAWGHSNKEVAAQLAISIKTVESYRAAAVGKVGLRGRSDILRYALSRGWLDGDSAPD